MILKKILRYAEQLGLDKDELMQMTVIEAITRMEEVEKMWKEVRKIG